MPRFPAALLALALAACGPSGTNTAAPSGAAATNSAASEAKAATNAAAPAAAPPAAPGLTMTSSGRVELAADGILYRDPETQAVRKISFGDSQQDATAQLVQVTSESTEYFPPNRAGCSETTFGETAAFFQGDRFIGYSTSSRDLKTAAGIGVGSTRRALEAAYEARFEMMESGDYDFTIPGMRGEVSGQGDAGMVTSIAAGEICGR